MTTRKERARPCFSGAATSARSFSLRPPIASLVGSCASCIRPRSPTKLPYRREAFLVRHPPPLSASALPISQYTA